VRGIGVQNELVEPRDQDARAPAGAEVCRNSALKLGPVEIKGVSRGAK
jgi:hypothetical protein